MVSYYILTFLVSWGGLLLLAGGTANISSRASDTPFLTLYLVTVAGPCLAGIILTGVCDGTNGYRHLFSRLFKWRVNAGWYVAAWLIAPATVFTALFLLAISSRDFLPAIFISDFNLVAAMFGLHGTGKTTLFLFICGLGIFNGFVEELGWTGFAIPGLKKHYDLFATGVISGVLWGLWHLLSNYTGSATGAGNLPLALYLTVILFSFLPPFRVLMTWVYDATGSLLLAIFMHASLDVAWILSMPRFLTGEQRVLWYLLWSVLLWGIVALVKRSVVSKKNSTKHQLKTAAHAG